MTITATITARGADSTVPDHAGAVDATIYRDGEQIGRVTLLPDPGAPGAPLSTWGPGWDHWADDLMRRVLAFADALDVDDMIADIEAAVREAAE